MVSDQDGRIFVVTGANSGLGAMTARTLAASGARVILACRDLGRGEAVARELGARAQARRLDLADLASVRKFAESIETVDVLVNNAGVMGVPFGRTADGFESQIGTNHLGHFALTGLLLNKIRDRVVTVSSLAHMMGKVDLGDPHFARRRYRPWGAYCQSKLANLLFTYELQRRLTAAGSPVLSVAAHPGWAGSDRAAAAPSVLLRAMGWSNSLIAQGAARGALSQLHAATADVKPGACYGPGGFGGLRGDPRRCATSGKSRDRAMAVELWALSEQLTGVVFPVVDAEIG
ncbi:oxidoreductase [Nocardia niigatensis]